MAIALSLLALVLFDVMGLIIKYLSPWYTAAELSAYRNFFGIFPSLIALWSSKTWHQNKRQLRIKQWKLGLMRGFYVTPAQFLFYYALGKMAFATASTIAYANALFMTALVIPLLGERVGEVRWSAVPLGFAGILLIMKPGSDRFTFDALAPFGAAFLYALAGVSARQMDQDVPSPLVNLYSVFSVFAGALALAFVAGGFSPLARMQDLFCIIAMGTVGGIAVLCLVVSFRMAEQSNLAPFSYFGIPIAFVVGWLVFDEAPWSDLFPGALPIMTGGLMVIWRDRGLSQRR